MLVPFVLQTLIHMFLIKAHLSLGLGFIIYIFHYILLVSAPFRRANTNWQERSLKEP